MKSPCLESGCGSFATYRGRCQRHSKQRDKSINRAGRKVYATKRWKLLRRRKLYLTPLCEQQGCTELATDVHHKHGVENDAWSLDGLEALCASCHNRETRRNQLERSA